jgi:molecular chaperone GrpE
MQDTRYVQTPVENDESQSVAGALPHDLPQPGGAPSSSEASSAAKATPGLEEQLKQAVLTAQEHHDAWLRARAEADNIRKRAQADITSAHKYAIENFSSDLVAVKDSLEAALAADKVTIESLKSGVELTLKQLNAVFEKNRITEINPAGQKFDPHRHQAITTVESDAEPNSVVQVFQKGYALNDRVIRPAMVSVAKNPTDR